MRCYCCSSLAFADCCHPFVTQSKHPETAEQLMRSRFTAYVLANFTYVLNTYSSEKQIGLSTEGLKESAGDAVWFALKVANSSADTVEFTAYFFENKGLYQLHETSTFVKEGSLWRYHDGILHDDCGKLKYGRNLPCLCHSGKKFKQCCANKMR